MQEGEIFAIVGAGWRAWIRVWSHGLGAKRVEHLAALVRSFPYTIRPSSAKKRFERNEVLRELAAPDVLWSTGQQIGLANWICQKGQRPLPASPLLPIQRLAAQALALIQNLADRIAVAVALTRGIFTCKSQCN